MGDVFEKFWEAIVEPPDRHVSVILHEIEEFPSKFGDWKRYDRKTADACFSAMPPLVYDLLDPKYTEEYHKGQMVIVNILSAAIRPGYVSEGICQRFLLHCIDHMYSLLHFWGEKNVDESMANIDILADAICGLIGRERFTEEDLELKQIILDHMVGAVVLIRREFPPVQLFAKFIHIVDGFKHAMVYKRLRINTSRHTWPSSLLILVKNMLSSRAALIPATVTAIIYHIIEPAFYVIEEKWFKEDVKFFCLMTHLNTAQMRLCLDRPVMDENDRTDVGYQCSIAQMAMDAAEKEENASWITDDIATKMACTIQEFATYILQYWKEATEQNIVIDIELQGVFFTFFCELVRNNGMDMIKSDVIDAVCIQWAATFRRLLIDRNLDVLRYVIAVLADIPKLPNDYPILVTSYAIQLVHGERKWTRKFERLVKAIEILIARDDWYTEKTLEGAIFMLIGEKKCKELLVLFETKMMWIKADKEMESTADCTDTPCIEGLKISMKEEEKKNDEKNTKKKEETKKSDETTTSKAEGEYSI